MSLILTTRVSWVGLSTEAKRLMTEMGFIFDPEAVSFKRLTHTIARGGIERLQRREARMKGVYEHKSFDRLFDPVDGVAEPQVQKDVASLTIAELVDDYIVPAMAYGAGSWSAWFGLAGFGVFYANQPQHHRRDQTPKTLGGLPPGFFCALPIGCLVDRLGQSANLSPCAVDNLLASTVKSPQNAPRCDMTATQPMLQGC